MMISSMILAMLASGTAATAPKPADQVVCRRFAETGSLVKKRRVCYTRAQWAKMNERTQDAARQFVDENRSVVSGN
nr:hypothetical protein [uncultured Sphingosinicella sp.]